MKRQWYLYLIIGLSILSITSISLLVPFLILWNIDEKDGKDKLKDIYREFESIGFENEFYCVANDDYASYNRKIININSLFSEKDAETIKTIMPNEFLPYTSAFFDDYIYSTKDNLFFSYSIRQKSKKSFLIFKTSWEIDGDITFVASLDCELSSAPIFCNYDEDGSYFGVKNSEYYDIYYFSIKKCTFQYLETINTKPEHASLLNVQNGTIKNNGFEIVFNNNCHLTSFNNTCPKPYEIVELHGFKPSNSLQLGNYTLCIYRYDSSFTHDNSILAVFSFDWQNNTEQFQGIYTLYDNGYYVFYHVY